MQEKINEAYKNTKFTFIMTIITFLISLFFIIDARIEDWSYCYIVVLASLLPFIYYGAVTIISNKFLDKIVLRFFLDIITFFITILLIWYYLFVMIL